MIQLQPMMEMMMVTKKNTLFVLLMVLCTSMFSQGLVMSDLTVNAVLIQKHHELEEKGLLRTPSTDTLPFNPTNGILEDFSYDGPYPDTALWLDDYVFINRDYPYAPPTIGVLHSTGLMLLVILMILQRGRLLPGMQMY